MRRHRHDDDKVQRLRTLPGFGALPARRLRAIAGLGDLVELDAGRVLQPGGHRPRGSVLVLDGSVEVRGVGVLGPGQFVGGDEVLDDRAAAADAVATTPVTGLAFHAPAMRSLFAATA